MFINYIEDLSKQTPESVYVPTFSNFFGYNDRFAYGGSEVMDVYNDRFDMVDQCPEFHPESMLKYCLDSQGISVKDTEARFLTIRKNGEFVYPIFEERFGDKV
jgi:hypothetical protein